ncbi:MFS transporter [Pseudonocardia lacus]|uniref:MFS transporter n=1 Tax=Pseudonocardia lacus TaxID=2835865 RepID=UPI001BDC1CEF|nr:MFS transporter [Pseudonocardia lacus]
MAPDPTDRDRTRYAWRVLSVVSMASIAFALGTSSLNVALPDVVRAFDASAAAASWMLLSFMLANTVLMVVFGRLADMFGRRSMYLWGLATYTAASLALGFAPDEWWIVGLRVVQAAGGAMLLANSAALLTDAFPRHLLGRGMGVYIASFSVAQVVGPTLGGFLSHRFGWQWVFWFSVPLGLVCLVWGIVALRRAPPTTGERGLDLPGNLLVLVSLGGLLIGLSQVSDHGWTAPVVLIGIALFVVLLPVFVVVERRSANPVVDMGLFTDRVFSLGLTASFLSTSSRMAVVLLVALFYQAAHGEDPITAGLRVLPMSAAMMVFSASSGLLHRWLDARRVAVLGNAVSTAGLLLLTASISATGGYATVCVALVLLGVGSGLFVPANTTALLDELPANRVGIVNAMRLMVINTAIVVTTALALTSVTAALPAALRPAVFAGTLADVAPAAVEQLVLGYRVTLAGMAVVSALSILAVLGARRSARTGRNAPVAVGAPEPVASSTGR